ncbi:hypothetical protein [Streptomyces sp. NRRL S-118]|uniref:hypothetical protein n=1 Tax=Streptomyces sp. NRRL S-118 TaxID=1463881 RepID=UPI00131A7763|nr:hypothetical protein [Streptomyces sp. NRRL S-118]
MTTGGGAAAVHTVLVGRGITTRIDGTELMDFVTVDGRPMRGVPSVVTKWAFSAGTLPGSPVTLVHDPEHPERASRPPTAGFLARTAVLACVGAVPFVAGAAMVVTALTG